MRCDKSLSDGATFVFGIAAWSCGSLDQSVMLSSISWYQYFAAVAVISTSYYVYVLLRYYQKEIAAFLAPKANQTALGGNGSFSSSDIMGDIKPDHGVSIVEDQDLNFADDKENALSEQVIEQPSRATPDPLSQQDQLLKETDVLITAFTDGGSKAEFLSLLAILYNSYRQFYGDIDFTIVNRHVLAKATSDLTFECTAMELSELLPENIC